MEGQTTLTVRLPSALRKKLRLAAVNQDTTMNAMVVGQLKEMVERYERSKKGSAA